MKPKNFPGHKLKRKLKANGEDINSDKNQKLLEQASKIRTKKNRPK